MKVDKFNGSAHINRWLVGRVSPKLWPTPLSGWPSFNAYKEPVSPISSSVREASVGGLGQAGCALYAVGAERWRVRIVPQVTKATLPLSLRTRT